MQIRDIINRSVAQHLLSGIKGPIYPIDSKLSLYTKNKDAIERKTQDRLLLWKIKLLSIKILIITIINYEDRRDTVFG